MKEPRNPFLFRSTERIETDNNFLHLFSPKVLNLLGDTTKYFENVHIFQSSPGGGKTSLFRVFTPNCLVTLNNSLRDIGDGKTLYKKLEQLGAISEGKPILLGVSVSCATNFANLEDLSLDPEQKRRLFFSLLNVRLTFSMLRGALILKGLQFPEDLEKLNVNISKHHEVPFDLPSPCSGEKLFNETKKLERKICRTIDSLVPVSNILTGHDDLYSFYYIRPDCIEYDGEPIAQKILVMLDDVHKLSEKQRDDLIDNVVDGRYPMGIWLAERLESLSPKFLVSGSTDERDYNSIYLEGFWAEEKNSEKFEKVVSNISNKRASAAKEIELNLFDGCLQPSISSEWEKKIKKGLKVIEERANNTTKNDESLQSSFSGKTDDLLSSAYERKIDEIRLRGLQLNFEGELPKISQKEKKKLQPAAEFLFSQEAKIPYYFGFKRLAFLASYNIEQFLAFSGKLFEEVISSLVIKQDVFALTPQRQEEILREVAEQRWNEIPNKIPTGSGAQKLLRAICEFSYRETYQPNMPFAPYPGITGIGLSDDEESLLTKNREFEKLLETLSECIANNLLFIREEVSHGKNGKKTKILYLNRWLCLKFNLPLDYKGWKPKKTYELQEWLNRGFRNSSNTKIKKKEKKA